MKSNQHIIIYNDREIHYIEADLKQICVETNLETYVRRGGISSHIPLSTTYTLTTIDGFDNDKIQLDPTLMKRIAKYNKTRELQQIEKQIKEKQEQIKELDELLQDKQKRWKKVKDYIANIYELDLDEDNEDDYDYYI